MWYSARDVVAVLPFQSLEDESQHMVERTHVAEYGYTDHVHDALSSEMADG